jgi:hypothetical protein
VKIFPCLLLFSFSHLLTGCSVTNDAIPDHSASDIQNYFAPQNSAVRYLWKHSDLRKNTDTLSYFQYNGGSADTTADGFSPISIYGYSDTSRSFQEFKQFFISERWIASYGRSAKDLSTRTLLLSDTLKKGKSWVASDSFMTAGGAHSKIVATVDDYYPSIIAANKEYADSYRVTFQSLSISSITPTQPEYKTNGRIVRYFARNVGIVLEIAYAPDNVMVWKNELVTTLSN